MGMIRERRAPASWAQRWQVVRCYERRLRDHGYRFDLWNAANERPALVDAFLLSQGWVFVETRWPMSSFTTPHGWHCPRHAPTGEQR